MRSIAKLFGEIGFSIPSSEWKKLDKFQQRLTQVKNQLISINQASKKALRFQTSNAALMQTLGILKQINSEVSKIGTVRVRTSNRTSGGGGSGGGGARNQPTGWGERVMPRPGTLGGVAVGAALAGGWAGVSALQNTWEVNNRMIAAKAAMSTISKDPSKELAFLNKITNELGINFLNSTRSYTSFLSAAQSVGFEQEKTNEIFSSTLKISRVLGLSQDDMQGTLRALTQMLSKGTISAEELKTQLGDRLPGAVGRMAKSLGMEVPELFKLMEKGEVISSEALPKFAEELRKLAEANGALAASVNSPDAKLQRFINGLQQAQIKFGQSGFMKGVSTGLEGVGEGLNNSSRGIEVWGRIVGTALHFLAQILQLLVDIPVEVWLMGITAAFIALAGPLAAPIAGYAALALVVAEFYGILQGGQSVLHEWARNGGNSLLVWGSRFLLVISEIIGFLIKGAGILAAWGLSAFDPSLTVAARNAALKDSFSTLHEPGLARLQYAFNAEDKESISIAGDVHLHPVDADLEKQLRTRLNP